jgi:hypothetical protein
VATLVTKSLEAEGMGWSGLIKVLLIAIGEMGRC